ncbi:MAG: DUF2231 domain-containing protein [Gammaproteobacteria bacterium]
MEIIPNWHPIFVHFTVALLSLSVGLFIVSQVLQGDLRRQWELVARWNLWFGVAITLLTVAAGFYAFNTVRHDEPSHLAMQEHRNWALATVLWFLALAFLLYRSRRSAPGKGQLLALVLGGGLLLSTAWHGAELVYRYGLGVMALPAVEAGGEGHEHGATGDNHASGKVSGEQGESTIKKQGDAAPAHEAGQDEGHAH